MSLLAESDLAILKQQLGRLPRGVVAVVVRCPAGHPAVVLTSPVIETRRGQTPFPTMYWLTCPHLRQVVSEIERTGGIAEARRMIAGDEKLRAAVARDHRRYATARWAMLTVAQQAIVKQKGWEPMLRDRGVAGTASDMAVKCLHAHLAHHLAAGNTLGRWLQGQYGVRLCV